MPDVRTFPSSTQARAAADTLLARGILARVIEGRDLGYVHSGHTVIIAEASELPRARALLNQMNQESESPDPNWESQAAPDLSRLDPSTRAPCPSCGKQLPLANIEACPACGAAVDVPDILVRLHGPELLAACFEVDEPDIPDELLDAAIVHCPGCGYALEGLAPVGTCPECGGEYSKKQILRGPG